MNELKLLTVTGFTVLLLQIAGCELSRNTDHPTFNNAMKHFPEFDLQGHRGARGLLPENTIPGLIKALEFRVTTLEFDIVVTADSQIVLSHEPWFHHHFSTTPEGRPVTPGTGMAHNIFEMDYNEVIRYDVGKRGHVNFPEQEPIPAFKPLMKDAILAVDAHIREHDLPPVFYNIETKSREEWYDIFVPPPDVFARLIYDELKKLGITDRVFIQSFDVRILQYLRDIAPELPLVLLVSNTESLQQNLKQLGFIPDIYSPAFSLVDEKLVKQVHRLGMKIVPWTVNEPEDMIALVKMGVDGIITDYPDRAIRVDVIKNRINSDTANY